ncbi:MAG: N-acetylmuramoyl-L-alanine amidase [Muribaculaceae bacterium]|nr:N-acetylmuramoyl-L-alanine amidase [Muribaculaceae bacterium]
MRTINKIIIHCSAGNQKNTAKDIIAYHLMPKVLGGRGWKAPGYHYIIEADGQTLRTWPEESISNGCKGQNAHAINVCYIGGVDTTKPGYPPVDNRTPAQKAALIKLLKTLRLKYPKARIYGHRDFAAKACPSFDATKEYADL